MSWEEVRTLGGYGLWIGLPLLVIGVIVLFFPWFGWVMVIVGALGLCICGLIEFISTNYER